MTLTITDVIPAQVVRGVDLVKGKTTLVRVNVTLNSSLFARTVTVKIYFDSQLRNSTSKIMNNNTEDKFNLFFVPNVTGTHNITATAEVGGQVLSNITKGVNINATRNLSITFLYVDRLKLAWRLYYSGVLQRF